MHERKNLGISRRSDTNQDCLTGWRSPFPAHFLALVNGRVASDEDASVSRSRRRTRLLYLAVVEGVLVGFLQVSDELDSRGVRIVVSALSIAGGHACTSTASSRARHGIFVATGHHLTSDVAAAQRKHQATSKD